ncbi:MAG TPA: LEA type 2 family protein [Povalibacter sp.]|uniref:LEA type 2 family protein n=1 Tax=Povalibacter sp. TaxID=1962978 RepID=UPI002CD9C4DD|nr:LEA type 2 family protein [Povalibacter sp.]HMN45546.1 LEA type 2 family protein [Povalibacter sp.]
MKKLRSLSILLLLAGITACSAMAPKLETPRLTIINASMTSGDVFSQNFLVHLNVQNPNDRDLPIKGIEYKLFLQGDSFAEGTSSRAFTVPANGETEFDMTVRTNFVSSVGRLLTRLGGKKQVEYVFEGKVMLASGMIRTIPFQESGTVDLATKL